MKKLLLIGLMLSFAGAFAQQSQVPINKALSRVNPALLKMKLAAALRQKNVDNGGPINRRFVPSAEPVNSRSIGEYTIGNTFYDLQTNNSISDRIVRTDSTIAAVWTYSPDGSTGYPSRGTGYNYFNGAWQTNPTARIEFERAGFPNIGITSTDKEAVIAHGIQTTGLSKGMVLSIRDTAGYGAWNTNDATLGEEPADTIDLWSKMAVGGPDGKTIHAIWRGGAASASYSGQVGPIYYSRSTDNGLTWPVLETIIPPLDSAVYSGFSADEYSIDARGNVVAVVASSLGVDVVLAKSTDNGDTWTGTQIFPFFPGNTLWNSTMSTDTNNDGIADTLWSGTGDANVIIDNSGNAHVFFSMVRTLDSGGVGLNYFPLTSEMFYWNDLNDSLEFIAYAPDLNGNGQVDFPALNSGCSDPFPFGTYGVTRAIEDPSPGIDANGTLYVVYQTVDELSDSLTVYNSDFDKLFKHPYVIKSTDGGKTWTDYNYAFDILLATQGDNAQVQEGVYASMAKHVDSQAHIIYQRDPYPGTSLAVAGSCDQSMNAVTNPNDIIYVGVDVTAVGIKELPSITHAVVLSPNFPNPATLSTQFSYSLNAAANVRIDVTDILGQNVYSENKGILGVGVHIATLNTSYLSAGVYFYSVTAGVEKVTGKMVVK